MQGPAMKSGATVDSSTRQNTSDGGVRFRHGNKYNNGESSTLKTLGLRTLGRRSKIFKCKRKRL